MNVKGLKTTSAMNFMMVKFYTLLIKNKVKKQNKPKFQKGNFVVSLGLKYELLPFNYIYQDKSWQIRIVSKK